MCRNFVYSGCCNPNSIAGNPNIPKHPALGIHSSGSPPPRPCPEPEPTNLAPIKITGYKKKEDHIQGPALSQPQVGGKKKKKNANPNASLSAQELYTFLFSGTVKLLSVCPKQCCILSSQLKSRPGRRRLDLQRSKRTTPGHPHTPDPVPRRSCPTDR